MIKKTGNKWYNQKIIICFPFFLSVTLSDFILSQLQSLLYRQLLTGIPHFFIYLFPQFQ